MGASNTKNSPAQSPKRKLPPPIPPKPTPEQRYEPCPNIRDESVYQTWDVQKNYEKISEPSPIGELINEFSAHLPLCFVISESLYGICENRSLLEDQLLSVHFQKKMKVLEVKANNSTGTEYSLPFSSTLIVSLIYDPENKPEKSRKGYIFDNPAELMRAVPMPKIVNVRASFMDINGKLVKENDILFIQSITEENNVHCMICVDMQTGKKFKIGESCQTSFVTSVRHTGVSLSKLMEFVTLPVDIAITPPTDGSLALPQSATNIFYTIVKEREENSVIATTEYISTDGSCSSSETIEIMLDVPIDVQLVELPRNEQENLRKTSKQLYDRFQPSKVDKIICDLDSSINYVQTALYKAIKLDSWSKEVTLSRPKPPGLLTVATPPTVKPVEPIDDEEYVDMEDFKDEYLETRKQYQPTDALLKVQRSQSLKTDSNRIHTSPMLSLQHSHSSDDSQISPYLIARRTQDERVEHSTPYDYVKFSKKRHAERQLIEKEIMTNLYDTLEESVDKQKTTAIKNKEQLKKYNCSEILQLLSDLGLQKYSEIFQAEKIDGAILAELDDSVLENELGITARLHRLKIMRILDGRVPIDSVSSQYQ